MSINELFVYLDNTVKDVVACIDQNRKGIVLIVDRDKKLITTLTDGDIRRGLLNNVTLEASVEFLLEKLSKIKLYKNPITAKIIFTLPNSDPDSRDIIEKINEYVSNNQHRSKCYTSLGQQKYLSAIKHVDVVIGNSSSGLIEVPAFSKPTINIGDRQKGRLKASSVIDCGEGSSEIVAAIQSVFEKEFQKSLAKVVSPYGYGGASKKIKKVLKEADLEGILKKRFHDVAFAS